MQPTSPTWQRLVTAFQGGRGVEVLLAILATSRNLALTSRAWLPAWLPPGILQYPYLLPTGAGVGALSLEVADDRSSRLADVRVQAAVRAGQLGLVNDPMVSLLGSLSEVPAVVLGAFLGGQAHDSLDLRTLFSGRITGLELRPGQCSFRLVDGAAEEHRSLEIPIGTRAFAGSPLAAHGQAVPLIIGTALGLQPPLVAGGAVGTLASALTTALPSSIDLTEADASFPPSGTLLVGSESIGYTGRRVGLLPNGTSALQLLAPVRSAPVAHSAGVVVQLAPPVIYRYLVGVGLAALEPIAVRDQDGPVTGFSVSPQ